MFEKIWHDSVRFGNIRQDLARFGRTWPDLTRLDMGLAGFYKVWEYLPKLDMIRRDLEGLGKTRGNRTRYGKMEGGILAISGKSAQRSTRDATIGPGPVRFGRMRQNSAGLGYTGQKFTCRIC